MIQNDEQLAHAQEARNRLESALRALRARVEPENPALFSAMAEDYRNAVAAIRRDIDLYLGIAELADAAAPLWMVLEGESVSGRDVSSRLLSEWLGKFRKALYGVTAYLETGATKIGRPIASIMDATDLQLVAVSPGSIRIGLKLPDPDDQPELFVEPERIIVPASHRALEKLLSVASWASSAALQPPIDGADVDELSVVARFAANLAPSPRSEVRTVGFSGAAVPAARPFRMTAESRNRLDGLVHLLSKVTEETVVGTVREIDLDAQRITLRERGPGMSDMKCQLPAGLIDRAESMLNKTVRVHGLISSSTPDTIQVSAVELVAPHE
jgi:hypothetical protein